MRSGLTHEEVTVLQKRGRRVRGGLLSMLIAPADDAQSRFSCVVSKKIAPTAVERNRIKRRCREAVRDVIKQQPASLVLLQATRAARDAGIVDMSKEIETLLEKARRG